MACDPGCCVFEGQMYDGTLFTKEYILASCALSRVVDVAACTPDQIEAGENARFGPEYGNQSDGAYNSDEEAFGDQPHKQDGKVKKRAVHWIFFNGMAFKKRAGFLPHLIEDEVMRTFAISDTEPENNDRDGTPDLGVAARSPGPRPRRNTHAATRAIGQARGGPLPISTMVFPRRSRNTITSRLGYGLDLPDQQRGALDPIVPAFKGEIVMNEDGSVKPRRSWNATHEAYVFDLVKLGTLQLNRELRIMDYYAITEALHRKFENVPHYPKRGVNSVNTKVVKDVRYRQWIDAILASPQED